MLKSKNAEEAKTGILYRHWRFTVSVFFLFNLSIAVFVTSRFLFLCSYSVSGIICSSKSPLAEKNSGRNANQVEYAPLTCSPTTANATATKCPAPNSNFTALNQEADNTDDREQPTCPEYFRWIHEDLWPWRETGITLDMVEMAATSKQPTFRLIIVNGTVYVETYRSTRQIREFFTQWGILQLVRLYSGKIPDLDIVFCSEDRPTISKDFFQKPKFTTPPPMFGYDGDDFTFDIPFPDWSFWGWPVIRAKPWEFLTKDLREGNERTRWVDRDPHAYWKGNHIMSESRTELLKCNVSDNQDWNALVYNQDWKREERNDFKNSNLANQCNHRYKIYIEGKAWSVSQKYILSCDSLTLRVIPRYYEFFSRSLMPLQHYWPIRPDEKCRSIKFAVEWGNSHQQEAQAMGKAASSFILEDLQMKYVYDYMFHLLTSYAKLLRYKPSVPPNAVQICPESMACPAEGLTKEYMMDTAVRAASDRPPCAMPPPYDPPTLQWLLEKKENSMKKVEAWEKQYWDAHNNSNSASVE